MKEAALKLLVGFAAIVIAMATVTSAEAKGCLKGAAVGGVAGHFSGHHGLLGAAAGCVIGRHEAKKRERMQNGQGYQDGSNYEGGSDYRDGGRRL